MEGEKGLMGGDAGAGVWTVGVSVGDRKRKRK